MKFVFNNPRNVAAQGVSIAPPGAAVSSIFNLCLLGSFSLTGPDGGAIEIASKKNRLLLAMLALSPGRRMSRDALASMLWGEHSDEQAKSSLRQALAVLRKELNGQHVAFFAAFDSTVAIHPGHLVLDTEVFLSEIKIGTSESLQRAIDLWRGPFIADVNASEPELEHWLTQQREHYSNCYVSAMDRLVPLLDGPTGVEMAQQLVQADNLREASHRHLMEAYYKAGEQSQALRHYEKLQKLLREELGVEPSPDIEELRNRIAANEHNGHNGHSSPNGHGAAAPPMTPPSSASLRLLQSSSSSRQLPVLQSPLRLLRAPVAPSSTE